MLQQLHWYLRCLSTAAACTCYTVLVVSRMHFPMQTIVQYVFSIVSEPDSAILSVAYYSLKKIRKGGLQSAQQHSLKLPSGLGAWKKTLAACLRSHLAMMVA